MRFSPSLHKDHIIKAFRATTSHYPPIGLSGQAAYAWKKQLSKLPSAQVLRNEKSSKCTSSYTRTWVLRAQSSPPFLLLPLKRAPTPPDPSTVSTPHGKAPQQTWTSDSWLFDSKAVSWIGSKV